MVSHGGRGGISNNSGEGGGLHMVLKKGPWTAAEDAVLLEYVKRHGEGNWNAVQKNTSLQRCGKSCRLRWANHLRPFLKKGPFTPEEEKTIIDLHAKIGNKWARMATQLPGRTDNEIKNYWNTRLKRRQRAGLPVYPVELLQQYNHRHHLKTLQNIPLSPSCSFASIISAAAAASSSTSHQNQYCCQNQSSVNFMKNCTPLDLLDYTPYRDNMNPSNSFSLPRQVINNGMTSGNGFSYQNGQLFHQALSGKSLSFDNLGLNSGPDPVSSSATNIDPVGLFGMGTGNNELSSIQNTVQTSNNSVYTGSDDVMGVASSEGDEEYDKVARGNSGLLGDLLEESQTIKRHKDNSEKNIKAADDQVSADTFFKDVNTNGLSNSTGSAFISGMNDKKDEAIEEMNIMDEDLLRLLDCPSPVCIPDWYDVGSSNNSNYSSREPSNVTIAHVPNIKPDDDDDWDEDICCWTNMPRVLS
ncbi:hypothetical protein DCAR_0418158 [Daucus carota subsp. sativus]|uniref:Transcription factor n=1 Tax=Daucus carota subsp. sativus TaxID=79200 RepID=A0A165Z769_DAUCS|nr:PREDICTED: transcription factor GAMYB-like [Daucus carota subsp. sativus]WOG98813.1 hypothetical protein DCAR_0418158 [Daucus carota subsp. sativus]